MVTKAAGEHPKVNLLQAAKAAYGCQGTCYGAFTVKQQKDKILIRMKSISSNCKCPKCNCITEKYHGTYNRKVQDLPILGKSVQLEICAHEYECVNDDCDVASGAKRLMAF